MAALLVPVSGFTLLHGEPVFYVSTADNGHQISRGFCGYCGSPVVTRLERIQDHVGIPAASLDDPASFKPAMDLFTASAQPWDLLDPALRNFPEGFKRD